MSKEKDRLLLMLNQRKISHDDYKLLSQALEKKSSLLNKTISLLVNPFQMIAGSKALMIGIFVLLSMSYLGVIANVYFLGILGIANAVIFKNTTMHPNFFLLLYQNIIAWIVVAMLFIISAILLRRKGIRIIDFLGTVALSRFPFMILTAFLSIVQMINPNFLNVDISKGISIQPSLAMSLFGFVVIICLIWQIAAYFFALKESSGLVGKQLWISFLLTLTLGEMISLPLTSIFFYM